MQRLIDNSSMLLRADLDNGISNLSHGHATREAGRGVSICHIGNEL